MNERVPVALRYVAGIERRTDDGVMWLIRHDHNADKYFVDYDDGTTEEVDRATYLDLSTKMSHPIDTVEP